MNRREALAVVFAVVVATAALSSTGIAQIKINEVGLGTPDWVELVNCSPGAIDISGWVLRNGYDTGSGFIEDTAFTFPAGTSIAGSGYLVVEEFTGGTYACSIATSFNFFWTATRTVAVLLEDGTGAGRDYVFKDYFGGGGTPLKPADLQWSGTLSAAGDVLARIQGHDTNHASDWKDDLPAADATPCVRNPGQSGDCSPFKKVMITEACSGNPDWVEITNFTNLNLNLGGWTVEWHDSLAHIGVLPLGTSIAPAESIVILETGSPIGPGVPPGTQQLSVMTPYVITNTGPFSVCLFDAWGVQVDEVQVSAIGSSGPPVFTCNGPWRGLVDRSATTAVQSVERIWGLDSDSGRDWTVGATPTCGRENTCSGPRGTDSALLSPQVLINEIDDSPDVIELYNASTLAVDLADWFLLCSGAEGNPHVKITPFVNQTILNAGAYIVIGDSSVPPTGLVGPYITVSGNSALGQNLPFTSSPFSCALYDRRGRVVDVVRATNEDCDLVHNHPRAPCYHSDWYGAAQRVYWSAAAVARQGVPDTNTGADWGVGDPPTWGALNTPVFGNGHGDVFDVRQNQSGRDNGLTVIFNGGPAKAGYIHHLFISVIPTGGCGGFLGLGPDAILNIGPIFNTPPFSGILDAQGAARFELDPGLMPPLIFESVWVLAAPSGLFDSRTLVLEYDNFAAPGF